MDINKYKEHVRAFDSLYDKARSIAQRLFPSHPHIIIEEYDMENVSFEANSQNYNDKEESYFPVEWLFSDDWEALVDARLAEKQAAVERKAAERKAEIERRERAMLKELQKRYQ